MTLPTPQALAARVARGAYLLDFADDMPDADAVDDVLAPFRVMLAETVAHAGQGEAERAEAAQLLYQVVEALTMREQVSRATASAATRQAQRMAAAAVEVRAQIRLVLEDAERATGEACVDTPIGSIYLRRTGRPSLTATPDDPSAWPIEWTRPGKPSLDKRRATEALARMVEAGLDLPEGFELDVNPRHPMLGR